MRVNELIRAIDAWAPFSLAADWDNVGLQIGDEEAHVSKVLIALDLDEKVINQAVEERADVVVTHHPLFFKAVSTISARDRVGRLALEAVRNGVNVIAAHTNLDVAEGGVSSLLAERLGLSKHKVLMETFAEKLFKLAVMVPFDYQHEVRAAMCDSGAGHIGNYSHCTFNYSGTGTFQPQSGANPFLGQVNQLEEVAEVKVETIVPQPALSKVLNSMLKAHPYEEVAYDILPLANKGSRLGFGRIGRLLSPEGTEDFLVRVKKTLNCGYVRVAGFFPERISKVAVLGGSGAGFIPQAAREGADVYLTADIKYHQAQEAESLGLLLVDPGHDVTERLIVPALANYLRGQPKVQDESIIVVEETDRKPVFSVF